MNDQEQVNFRFTQIMMQSRMYRDSVFIHLYGKLEEVDDTDLVD